MTRLPFEWHPSSDAKTKVDEVALTTTAIETVVALMARAMITVVRGADHTEEELGDER